MTYLNPEDATRLQRFNDNGEIERLILRAQRQRPWLTTDARRWPNVNVVNAPTTQVVVKYAGLADQDLVDQLHVLYTALTEKVSGFTIEDSWTIANVLDALIDEQDRRRGITPRPVERITCGQAIARGLVNFDDDDVG